jgi:hypothetical protein
MLIVNEAPVDGVTAVGGAGVLFVAGAVGTFAGAEVSSDVSARAGRRISVMGLGMFRSRSSFVIGRVDGLGAAKGDSAAKAVDRFGEPHKTQSSSKNVFS